MPYDLPYRSRFVFENDVDKATTPENRDGDHVDRFLKENNLEYTPVSAIAAMMLTFYIYNLYSYLSTVHLHYT